MRKRIGVFRAFSETIEQLDRNGVLLIAGQNGNPMTIGWGTIGIVWKKPIFIALIRPSRYSFELIEKSGEFTVNVLSDDYSKAIAFCGSHSGRNTDKIKHCHFTLEKGELVGIPHIKEAGVHYECRTVHKNGVIEKTLDGSIIEEYYPQNDYHSVYYGEILGVFRKQ